MAISTTAKNKNDVDQMSREEQLWDSLNYSYGKKGEQLSSEYNKAISQQDRALLSRGMQRSSAGMSTLAGLRNQRTKALDDNQSQLISTYEDRIQAIKDAEDARAFQTSEREAQQAWQSSENALNRQQSQNQFDIQQAFNEKQWEAQQSQWREEFDYNKKSDAQKLAYNYVVSIIGNGGSPSDALLAQAGLSRADANAMSKKKNGSSSGSSSGKYASDWYKAGFPSYAVAQQARAAGYNTYAAWLAAQKGTTGNPDQSILDSMGNVGAQDRIIGGDGANIIDPNRDKIYGGSGIDRIL